MARKLRVEYPGAISHVMTRGDRREPIFRDDEDRERFLATLSEACRAEEMIGSELERAGWVERDLRSRRKGDALKVRLAKRLRAQTTVTMKWIAQRLCMGTRGHLTHLLYWHGREMPAPPKARRAKYDKTIDTFLTPFPLTPFRLF